MSPKLLAGVVASLFAAVSVAHATVIASYDFQSSLATASTVDPNATASSLTRGTSTNAPISTNDFWISKPVMSISRSDDTAAQAYFQVTINAASGYELN